MKALLLYVTFVAVGSVLSALVGVYVENHFGSVVSLIVFLALFFTNFVNSWILTILVMDGTLKNAQGAADQREVERIGQAKIVSRRG